FLLPPTILMGGTLPVLVRRFTGGRANGDGTAVSALYAANTFGAAAGVAAAGFYTIPRVGLLTTIFYAVLLNFALALVAGLVAYLRPSQPAEPGSSGDDRAGAAAERGRWILAASFLMGLTSIADEVFWSRIFVLHLGSSVYAFSLMLFAFLVGIALGSALIHRVVDRADLVATLAMLEVALGVTLALQVHYLTHFSAVLERFATIVGVGGYDRTLVTLLMAVLTAILVPTTIMGATFPLTVRLFETTRGESESASVGLIYFVNTLGSIAGSLLAGFVLIRLIGSQNGLFAMAAVNIAVGAWFALRAAGRARMLVVAGVGAVILIISLATVRPNAVLLSAGIFDPKVPILLFREDVTATVTLRAPRPDFLSLELNGVNVAGTAPDLIGTQKLQGHLPLLLHPHPRSVLHIGFGSGGTAYAVSRHPVEEIRILEISPEVLETSDARLRAVNHGVLHDPRVHAQINDGRNFVLATPERFDVILSDSIHPRYAGNGSLYTKDYFELCRKRLNPNGVISMWLPTYAMTPHNYLQVLRAFSDVFPNTTVWYVPNYPNAFTIVIGRTEPGPIDLGRLRRQVTPAVAAELSGIGIHNEYDLAGALLLDPQAVTQLTSGVEPHVDDIPSVEYESGRVVDRDGTWLANFAMLGRAISPLPRAFTDVADPAAMNRADALRHARYEEHWRVLKKTLRR
ncbi:MAG: Polyamine aminopropyltransferase, partial [Acidobacteria bacterium]|nr:Polyamine aminopropyltransferase [Acidobacteriota bacterium]